MIDLQYARASFEAYLDEYDRENDKIRLKIVHTYGVVACAGEIARRMKLSEEDRRLAEVIALLHDIGRFEQLRRYDSFEAETMDHASYGVQLLFGEEGLIRRFVREEQWDEIIREAIAHHSDYRLPEFADEHVLLHAKLIRDADKLDNCRVKLEEPVEVMLGVSAETVGSQSVTDDVWQCCLKEQSVDSALRKTPMDYWVSYVAYFYDIYFPETLAVIREKQYVERIIGRIPCSNEDTHRKMELLQRKIDDYIDTVLKNAG